jgi:hypothetical protein
MKRRGGETVRQGMGAGQAGAGRPKTGNHELPVMPCFCSFYPIRRPSSHGPFVSYEMSRERGCFSKEMSLEGCCGMVGIDDQPAGRGAVEPGTDPGVFGRQR